MSPGTRNILLGVAFFTFLVSDLVLIKSNLRLRDELNLANRTIGTLQTARFHNDSGAGYSAPSPEIFLYDNRQIAHRSFDRQGQSYTIKTLSLDASAGLTLLDLETKYLGKDARSEFVLFVFFSPTDCPACLAEAPVWQKMYEASQRLGLSVIGVMNHPDKTEGEHFLKQMEITFPVFFDTTAFLKNKYRIGETPQKVLVDSKGQTLLISPGSRTEEEKQMFEESVLTVVARKSPK